MENDRYKDEKENGTYKLVFYIVLLFASLAVTAAIVLVYIGFESVSYVLFILSVVLFAVNYWLATRYYNPMDELREGGHGLLSRYVRFLQKYHVPIVLVGAQVIIVVYVLTGPRRTLGVTIATIVTYEIAIALASLDKKTEEKRELVLGLE